ncbi:hypothetical protein CGRA01v4_05135 [Colletotrichum graminicola]|nr:hypothetical protein CGRA01v4_05135 [Colletotrichum graminicola]
MGGRGRFHRRKFRLSLPLWYGLQSSVLVRHWREREARRKSRNSQGGRGCPFVGRRTPGLMLTGKQRGLKFFAANAGFGERAKERDVGRGEGALASCLPTGRDPTGAPTNRVMEATPSWDLCTLVRCRLLSKTDCTHIYRREEMAPTAAGTARTAVRC